MERLTGKQVDFRSKTSLFNLPYDHNHSRLNTAKTSLLSPPHLLLVLLQTLKLYQISYGSPGLETHLFIPGGGDGLVVVVVDCDLLTGKDLPVGNQSDNLAIPGH